MLLLHLEFLDLAACVMVIPHTLAKQSVLENVCCYGTFK